MSKAEEAAGRAYYQKWRATIAEIVETQEWGDLSGEDRSAFIADAMSIVAAHDAERWRVPAPEDWESRKSVLIVCSSVEDQKPRRWYGQWLGSLMDHFGQAYRHNPSDPPRDIMIADPLPLPPAPGGD